MLSDFHLHTSFSGDCAAPVRAQLDRAVALGMASLCITDHNDYGVDSGDIDFNLDFERYWRELPPIKEEYAGCLDIRIGLEMGLAPQLSSYCREIARRYPFDYIIGSTHFVDGKDPYSSAFFEGRSERDAYEEYFRAVLKNTETCDDYDVAGHLDYVVRYGANKNKFYSYGGYRELLDPIIKALAERGKGMECNTRGYSYGLGTTNPLPDILKRFRQLGGEIVTVGSDAHRPEDLGAHFGEAAEILKACGFTYYATFKGRVPEFHRL